MRQERPELEALIAVAHAEDAKDARTSTSPSPHFTHPTRPHPIPWQAKQQHLTELLEGLRIYFDNSLPVILLYPQERQQFADITKQHPDVPVSKIYGAEHLLRLFTKLPHVLGKARLASVESAQLQTNLGEFLKYLQKNHATIFLKNYEEYTPLAEGGEASGGGGAAGASSSGNGKEASEGGEG